MNLYVTGNTIKQLREQKKMTQADLADKIDVSSKTVSKWETAKGLPDISLLEPLSAALGVSVMELMKGDAVINQNRSANLLRSKLYVCPICGNVIHTLGIPSSAAAVCLFRLWRLRRRTNTTRSRSSR